jgi:hypothetical protein
LDPKVLRGDLTGIIEGLFTRVGLLSLHHIEKVKFRIFPRNFLWSEAKDFLRDQARRFVASCGVLGENFLRRSALVTQGGRIAVLNEGYSIALLPDTRLEQALTYLLGVEETFGGTPINLYDQLLVYMVPPNAGIQRYYLKSISEEHGSIVQQYGLATNSSEVITVVRRGAIVNVERNGVFESL